MKRFQIISALSIAAASLISCFAVPASAATVDTSAGATGLIQPFGATDTATYGQTFTVGTDTILQSFAMFLSGRMGGSGTVDLRGYVAGWDGFKATSILYTSATQTMNADGTRQEFDFDTGNLALVEGQRYVAFLSTSELASQSYSTFGMPYGSNALYAGGSFVYYNNSTNFGALTTNAWDCNSSNCSFADASFKLDLAASAVPEPATIALMGVGLFGVVGRRRRASKA
jgi:hypothetical protein